MTSTPVGSSTTVLEMAKSRKARRSQKAEKTRPASFYDAIDDAQGVATKKGKKKPKKNDPPTSDDPAEAARQAQMAEAQRRMDERPDVSTMLVDEESGVEVLQQGKNVMDVITRRAVKLSNGPDERLAQMFPGVPPDVRDKYRLDSKSATVPEMVEKLRQACTTKLEDGSVGIPSQTSVASKAIDFVIANRDLLGYKMKKTLGRLTMRSFSLGNTEEGEEYQKLWKNYLVLENYISAPFRQIMLDAEGKAGPNFGNLDIKSFLDGPLYERTANYLVLKGMVAHWEKKLIDADTVEKTPQTKENYLTMATEGDPRRFLPDPPILFTLKECTQVCYMAQQMTKTFVDTPELFNDLPPEIRFFEYAMSIKGGTPMRQFMKEDFCPAEGITPEALREGMRRLLHQLDNMQVDPYADIVNTMEKLIAAMSVGTDDENDPYEEYLVSRDPNGPGRFQSYTFNHDEQSLVKFFDSSLLSASGGAGESSAPSSGGGFGDFFNFGGDSDKPPGGAGESSAPSSGGGFGDFGDFFNFGGDSDKPPAGIKDMPSVSARASDKMYETPSIRAAGRPHELGWFDQMENPTDAEEYTLGKVPAGRIIPDEE
eukprot:CAMPEP_0172474602 /NCGR_PEP_ID=MMETSP1065-20121228/69443_1 /TAXON_ID=265537 /ORGANISM="Amphiprora paludosa, Strain CCMP125" /LENGTH=596 /DNA_ID=CAMNT_0013232789 /DNA_START=211 /DNA_END=2000 /DNA_ORIENTATION=+